MTPPSTGYLEDEVSGLLKNCWWRFTSL